MDPDPRVPKTCGSGSPTLLCRDTNALGLLVTRQAGVLGSNIAELLDPDPHSNTDMGPNPGVKFKPQF
jgi:hypothetical protein